MTGYSMRCTTCAISWPHTMAFQPCPICGLRTAPIHALDPREVLTPAEAQALMAERGVLPRPGIAAPQAQPPKMLGTGEKKFDLKKETKQLYEDLERWVKEAPPWTQ